MPCGRSALPPTVLYLRLLEIRATAAPIIPDTPRLDDSGTVETAGTMLGETSMEYPTGAPRVYLKRWVNERVALNRRTKRSAQ
jgi:hypothetical protein